MISIILLFLIGCLLIIITQEYLFMGDSNPSYTMAVFDSYAYIVVCPLNMIASTLLIIAHLWYKELRKHPGDLIVMIALSELGLSVHWFMSGVRSDFITKGYDDEGAFCKANSYVAVIAASFDTIYNMAFLTSIVFQLQDTIKGKTIIKPWMYHVGVFVASSILILSNQKKMGRNKFGTCSVDLTQSDVALGGILVVLYSGFASFVFNYVRRKLGSLVGKQSHLKRDFLNYYGSYIKAFIIMNSIVFVGYICQLVSFNSQKNSAWDSFEMIVFNLGQMCNCCKVLMPLLLFFIRAQDPTIAKNIFKPITTVSNELGKLAVLQRKMTQNMANFLNRKASEEDNKEQDLSVPTLSPHDNEGGVTTPEGIKEGTHSIIEGQASPPAGSPGSRESTSKKFAFEDEIMTDNPDDLSWMALMPKLMKNACTATFVASIAGFYSKEIKRIKAEENPEEEIRSSWVDEVSFTKIEPEKSMDELGTQESLMHSRVAFYAPRLFSKIIDSAITPIDFEDSMGIDKNKEQIRKAGESGGGASGELFMFSADKKLILKTITKEEFLVFLAIIKDYCKHLNEHPNSLIGRIYSLYSVEFTDTRKKVYLILMENVFSKVFGPILRKYDMKGSTYKRKVRANYQDISSLSEISEILKDVDFDEIEKRISFKTEDQRKSILDRLQTDSHFFKKNLLIDYSVIFGVVNRNGCNREELEKEAKEANTRIIDTGDGEKYYVIGIIDYFQLYTWGKAIERFVKRVSKCSPNLETSSQPPTHYSNRFVKFFENRLVLDQQKQVHEAPKQP